VSFIKRLLFGKEKMSTEEPKELKEPEKIVETTPRDDSILLENMPICLRCKKIMVLNGRGVQNSRMNTPVEYTVMFCSRCGTTAVTVARVGLSRFTINDNSKPKLAFDVYWGHPIERRETNARLAILEAEMKRDEQKEIVKEEEINYLEMN